MLVFQDSVEGLVLHHCQFPQARACKVSLTMHSGVHEHHSSPETHQPLGSGKKTHLTTMYFFQRLRCRNFRHIVSPGLGIQMVEYFGHKTQFKHKLLLSHEHLICIARKQYFITFFPFACILTVLCVNSQG